MDGHVLINILGGLLIITSLMVVISKTPRRAAYIYGAQSLVLVGILITIGVVTDQSHLFVWAGTAVVTKVILIPGMVLFGLKKMGGSDKDLAAARTPWYLIAIIAVEVLLCFLVVGGIQLPTAIEVKPALAISLAHFFIGLTCIVSQRNIVKQIFGFCLMENGSHVTLALLAPGAPAIVEIGIATDAIFAVGIMVYFAVRIYKNIKTVDTNEIMNLKG